MLSLVAFIATFVTIAYIVFLLGRKANSLIGWLQFWCGASFDGSVVLVVHYWNYYTGDGHLLQQAYFDLFYLSVLLLLLKLLYGIESKPKEII